MSYSLTATVTTTTTYEIEPETGFTRQDILSALQKGKASVLGDFIRNNDDEQQKIGSVTAKSSSASSVEWE